MSYIYVPYNHHASLDCVINFLLATSRATHNLYQLVKGHQNQLDDVEDTTEQLSQVFPCLSFWSISMSLLGGGGGGYFHVWVAGGISMSGLL